MCEDQNKQLPKEWASCTAEGACVCVCVDERGDQSVDYQNSHKNDDDDEKGSE